jgi:hypothetical protein
MCQAVTYLKIERAAEFGGAVFTREAMTKRLIAEAITAHGYSQIDVASFLRLHYSTISRILTVNRAQILKT